MVVFFVVADVESYFCSLRCLPSEYWYLLCDSTVTKIVLLKAASMEVAWRNLAQMHLIGSRLYAYGLGQPDDSVAMPRRRRRQAAEAAPFTFDMRALHDSVSFISSTI